MTRARTSVSVVVALLLTATSAQAEIAVFATGRTMSIKGHEIRGGDIVLYLRSGGEIIAPSSVIARIDPDEVPYPEPPAESPLPLPVEPSELRPVTPLRPEQQRYQNIIEKVAAEQGVDPKLVHAVIEVESNYQERARSPKGAKGLMQLMPATARQYSVSNPYDPTANIEAGIKHLKSLLVRFTQNLPLALAAYNAGEAAVDRFGGIPPYQETRNYVSRILRIIG
jgi:soluble lytic murein transglycosylase-like protein